LAQFRCNEIANKAFENMVIEAKILNEKVQSPTRVTDLGTQLKELKSKALDEYDQPSQRYDKKIFKKVRAELIDRIHNYLRGIFMSQVKKELTFSATEFKQKFPGALAKGRSFGFLKVSTNLEEEIRNGFERRIGDLILSESDWSYDYALQELKEIISTEIATQRKEESKKLRDQLEQSFKAAILIPLNQVLKDAQPNIWTLSQNLIFQSAKMADEFTESLKPNLGCTEMEISQENISIKKHMLDEIARVIRNETSNRDALETKTMRKFNTTFRANGVWRSVDDLKKLYEKGKAEAEELLRTLTHPDLNLVLLDANATLDSFSITPEQEKQLKEHIDIETKEALRVETQKAGDITEIFFSFFGGLNFDEIMASSPQFLFRLVKGFITTVAQTKTGQRFLLLLTLYIAGRQASRLVWK